MGQFSITHIALVLILVLLFFGPSKLPQLGQSLGKAIRGFKDGIDELKNEIQEPIPPKVAGTLNEPSIDSSALEQETKVQRHT